MYKAGDEYDRRGDYQSALSCYQNAIKGGSTKAMYRMGLLYVYGRGVKTDWNTAAELFNMACKNGDPDGLAGLGQMYKEAKDYKNAVACFQKGMEYKSAPAINGMGVMYYNGTGVTKDSSKAVKLFKEAAQKGNFNSMRNVGLCYENGEGVEKSGNSAYHYYKLAAENGWYQCYMDMARLYKEVEKNNQKALNCYEKAADLGYVPAMARLGNMYYSGKDIVYQNYDKAKAYYEIAADKNDPDSMNNLGVMYYNGYGVKKDLKQAQYWFKQASLAGSEKGTSNLEVVNNAIKNASQNTSSGSSSNGKVTKKDLQKASETFSDLSEKAETIGALADSFESEGLSNAAESVKKWSNRAAIAAEIFSWFAE
ncbi:MAG: tetratricopeptide repeat protein [Lachnospiraceae bacterium]|nr:tetratricopeptide repeat protein [Lachnospiraceae bacterium]